MVNLLRREKYYQPPLAVGIRSAGILACGSRASLRAVVGAALVAARGSHWTTGRDKCPYMKKLFSKPADWLA
jgi:hypothetical protein